jgi:glycosyl transferase family 2
MSLCAYLLPLRRAKFCSTEAAGWRTYFDTLRRAGCEIIVVDGSPPETFAAHAAVFASAVSHVPVDRRFGYLNDKVNGVHTGVALTQQEKIILADDDIRYTPETIAKVVALLDRFEVVRPQNFLHPLPWWAKMESARMLINRATLRTGDYPGTCAFRRSAFLRVGHYDGDVLFDNEEIIRHFAEKGATIHYAIDLFVQKLPPRFRKWLEQRPRQAYEDFGLRVKTFLFLSLLPLLVAVTVWFGFRGGAIYAGVVAVISFLLALLGFLRGQARKVMSLSPCFFAPLWVGERTISTYVAVYWYFAYGGYPFGERILSKGIGRAWRNGGRVALQQLTRR